MNFKNFLDKKVIVTQKKSNSKLTKRQKGSLVGLQLRGISSSSDFIATDSILGMMHKVAHIIEVKENK
jgi:ribosomal protein L30/L7E